jgi:hypothetical protein
MRPFAKKIIAALWLAVYFPLIVTLDLFHNHEAVVRCCGDHAALIGLEFHNSNCGAAHHCAVDALLSAHGPLSPADIETRITVQRCADLFYTCSGFPLPCSPQGRAPPAFFSAAIQA